MGEMSWRPAHRARVGLIAVAACVGLAQAAPARAAGLPDGRAYELVTPGLDGVPIVSGAASDVITPSGDVLDFQTTDAPDTDPSSTISSLRVATRTATGWTQVNVEPALTQSEEATAGTISTPLADGLTSLITTDQPLTATANLGANLFLRSADGTYTLLTPTGDGAALSYGFLNGPSVDGVSADGSHIFFAPKVAQLADDPLDYATGESNLYQWADGSLSIVNVMPDGSLGQSSASVPYVSTYGLSGISGDGSSVLFQESGDASDLYLRIDGTRTVDVSLPQGVRADPNAQVTSVGGVTADGSDVLFTDSAQLTADANTGGRGKDLGDDLYEYDVASGRLVDLTADGTDPDGAAVQTIVAADPAASYVYFTAQGDLAAGATSGATNLYVEHDGAITYIGAGGGLNSFDSEVTPDGQFFLIETTDPLTGYDNTDADTGSPDSEVFEYDAVSDSLTCLSCRADGTPPTGSSSFGGSGTPAVQDVSDDGSRVFFQSSDAVIPAASNGLQNVFEYEDGQVYLISPGNGPSAAQLIGTTPSGDDVFFYSHDDLVPGENPQGASAIYDARVGGGFPVTGSSAGAPCTATGGCHAASPTPSPPPVIATATFDGPGNRSGGGVAHLTVRGRTVSGGRIAIRVRIPAAGRLTVSGASIMRETRSFTHARTVSLSLSLTARATRSLARRHRLRVTASLRFTARGGGVARSVVHVTTVERTHR